MAAAVPTQLLNAPADCVEEMVQGILACHHDLVRLGTHHVLLRRDFRAQVRDAGRVAVLSGGGSGHEPAHAGFVGQGMLTGAICGGVFASPSVQAVLDAVRAVTGPGGCLLVVKNYTGDRLNFGIAAEQARAEGLDVQMVIVGDDVAVNAGDDDDGTITGRRGLAGTLFVHKVAGAAAEAGASLAQVVREVNALANPGTQLGSFGVALTTCDVPGVESEPRIAAGQMELGLGIHNEPGRVAAPCGPVDQTVRDMLARIVSVCKISRGSRVCLMVNNLGSSTPVELYVAARVAIATLEGDESDAGYGFEVCRAYVGAFMTSLNMHGLMLTVCVIGDDDARLARLDAPTAAPAWPKPSAVRRVGPESAAFPSTVPVAVAEADVSEAKETDAASAESAADVARGIACARAACEALLRANDQLNDLDKIVGDGDTGTTMSRGAADVLAMLDSDGPGLRSCGDLCAAVASALRMNMGGSSGAVLDIMLHTAAAAMRRGGTWAQALDEAVSRASFYGGAKKGFCTMLDALFPAAEAALSGGDLAAVAAAAERGAEATKQMGAKAGRSSYLSDAATDGHADPGAVAMAIAFRAML